MTENRQRSTFVKQILIYGLGIALNYGIGFILLPLYSRLMPVEQFGILEILNRTVGVISLLILANYAITFIRFYREKEDPEYRKLVTSTCMLLILCIAAPIAGVATLLREPLAELLFKSEEYSFYFVLLAGRYFLGMLFVVPFVYYQATEQPGRYVAVSASKFAMQLVLTVLLLYNMEDKVAAVLYGFIITNIIYLSTVGLWIFMHSARRIDLGIAKQLVRFTWSFTFLGIFGFIMSNGDRYVLNEYCGKSAVGIYSFGYKIGLFLNTIVFSPIIRAWNARMVDIVRRPDGTAQLAKLTSYALLIYTFSALLLSVYAREVVLIVMGPRYYESYIVIPLIVFAYAFWGISLFFDTGIYVTKKTYLKTWQGVTAAVSVGLYLWLIPKHCMMGAAWATVGTYFCYAVLSWYLNTRALPTRYEFGKLLKILMAAVILYLGNYYLESVEVNQFGYLRELGLLLFPVFYHGGIIVLKFAVVPLFCTAILLTGVIDREDIARLKDFITNLRKSRAFDTAEVADNGTSEA